MDKEKIKNRIKEIEIQLFVPTEGRVGGSWDKKIIEELTRLNEYLTYAI